MTDQLIAELQNDFSSAGIEFLRKVEIKSSALFDFIKPHLDDLTGVNENEIWALIAFRRDEFSSMEGSFAFNLVLSSLMMRGRCGAVLWAMENFEQIQTLI